MLLALSVPSVVLSALNEPNVAKVADILGTDCELAVTEPVMIIEPTTLTSVWKFAFPATSSAYSAFGLVVPIPTTPPSMTRSTGIFDAARELS